MVSVNSLVINVPISAMTLFLITRPSRLIFTYIISIAYTCISSQYLTFRFCDSRFYGRETNYN